MPDIESQNWRALAESFADIWRELTARNITSSPDYDYEDGSGSLDGTALRKALSVLGLSPMAAVQIANSSSYASPERASVLTDILGIEKATDEKLKELSLAVGHSVDLALDKTRVFTAHFGGGVYGGGEEPLRSEYRKAIGELMDYDRKVYRHCLDFLAKMLELSADKLTKA